MSTLAPDSVETAGAKQSKGLIQAFRDQQLAVFWALCACGGGFAIWASQGLVVQRLLIPVAIMFFFGWRGYVHANRARSPLLRATRIAQLADSLYFLGFLWTLWALIDSFVFKQMPATQAVFRTFGYALVTTATGMFLRLLLLQFKYWAHDQVPEAGQELEKQIERFTNRVTGAAGAIDEFRVKSDAALGRWITALDNRTTELEKSVAGVQDQAARLKTDLEALHAHHLGQISASATRAMDAVKNTATGATGEVARVADARLRSVADTCERGAQALEAGARSTVESFHKAMQPALTALAGQAAELSRQAGALSRNTAALDAQWTQRTGQFSQQISAAEQSIARATQSFAASVAAVNKSLGQVAGQIASIRVPESVVEAAVERVVERRLSGFSQPLRSTIDELARATHELARATARLNAVQRGWWRRFWG
jgi:DNA anti-recombination protein RmuC